VPVDSARTVHQTKEPQHKDDFDEWLARIVCFAFSVPPQWAVKQMNRATADNQSAQSEAEGLEPTKEWVKDLVDEIIAEEFASPDLELHWLDEDDGDPETVLADRLKLGAVTLNEMRDHLGLDPYANPAADRAMVLTPTGYVPIEANVGGEGAINGQPRDSTKRSVEAATFPVEKASPDDAEHPGWPAGTPGGKGGQFRPKDGDGGERAEGASVAAEHTPRWPERYAALDTGMQTDASRTTANTQYAQLNVQNNAKTNNPVIDRTTDILLQTLARIYALAGDGSGSWYGTRIHTLFASDVRLQNLPGIGRNGVEQSFSLGDIAKFGEDGTIRVDVYIRDENGKIIAIWDVKTGGAVLTGARVRQLRTNAGVGADVPVIELHMARGATFKARAFAVGTNVMALLW
jgi:hypothetical protein